jgi:endonuclease YncB( thermonuclease family)
VIDGDTLAAGAERLRIDGIDAPEMHQMCERRGIQYACGQAARAAMARIIGNGPVTCDSIRADRYGRDVVRCAAADGRDIAAALVAQGWALAYRQYSMDYVPQEEAARAQGLGLWAGRFDAPWDWRHRQRE